MTSRNSTPSRDTPDSLRPRRLYQTAQVGIHAAHGLWQTTFAWFLVRTLEFELSEVGLVLSIGFAVQALLELPSGAAAQQRAHTGNLVALGLLSWAVYALGYAALGTFASPASVQEHHAWFVLGAALFEAAFGYGAALLTGTLENWLAEDHQSRSGDASVSSIVSQARFVFAASARLVTGLLAVLAFVAGTAETRRVVLPAAWLVAAALYVYLAERARTVPAVKTPTLAESIRELLPTARNHVARDAVATHIARSADYLGAYPEVSKLFLQSALVTSLTWIVHIFWIPVGLLMLRDDPDAPRLMLSAIVAVVLVGEGLGIAFTVGSTAGGDTETNDRERSTRIAQRSALVVAAGVALICFAVLMPAVSRTIWYYTAGVILVQAAAGPARAAFANMNHRAMVGDRAVLLSGAALLRSLVALPLTVAFGLVATFDHRDAIVMLMAVVVATAAMLHRYPIVAGALGPQAGASLGANPWQDALRVTARLPMGLADRATMMRVVLVALGAAALIGTLFVLSSETSLNEGEDRIVALVAVFGVAMIIAGGWPTLRHRAQTLRIGAVICGSAALAFLLVRVVAPGGISQAVEPSAIELSIGHSQELSRLSLRGSHPQSDEPTRCAYTGSSPCFRVTSAGGARPISECTPAGFVIDSGSSVYFAGPIVPARLSCARGTTPIPVGRSRFRKPHVRGLIHATALGGMVASGIIVLGLVALRQLGRAAIGELRSLPLLHAIRGSKARSRHLHDRLPSPWEAIVRAQRDSGLVSDAMARFGAIRLVLGAARIDDKNRAAWVWTWSHNGQDSEAPATEPLGLGAETDLRELRRRAADVPDAIDETALSTPRAASIGSAGGSIIRSLWQRVSERLQGTAQDTRPTALSLIVTRPELPAEPWEARAWDDVFGTGLEATPSPPDSTGTVWAASGVVEASSYESRLTGFALMELPSQRYVSSIERAALESIAWAALLHSRVAYETFLADERAHLAGGMASTAVDELTTLKGELAGAQEEWEDYGTQDVDGWQKRILLVQNRLREDAARVRGQPDGRRMTIKDRVREFKDQFLGAAAATGRSEVTSGVELELEFRGQGVERMVADWSVLARILRECVENARKHGDQRSGAVPVRITVSAHQSRVVFEVKNAVDPARPPHPESTRRGLKQMRKRVVNDLWGTWDHGGPAADNHFAVRFSVSAAAIDEGGE